MPFRHVDAALNPRFFFLTSYPRPEDLDEILQMGKTKARGVNLADVQIYNHLQAPSGELQSGALQGEGGRGDLLEITAQSMGRYDSRFFHSHFLPIGQTVSDQLGGK